MNFFFIILTIAVICLALFLFFAGILINSTNTNGVYPVFKNQCPDYWTSDSSGNCILPTKKSFTNPAQLLNTGNSNLDSSKYAPYSKNGTSFNINDQKWSSGGQSTICAQKDWANNNHIVWDGVSNFNKC